MNKKHLVACAAAILIILQTCILTAAEQPVDEVKKARDAYPRLFTGVLSSAKLVTLPPGTLFRSGDIVITPKDIDADIAKAPDGLKAQLRKNAFFILENQATMALVTAQAKAWAEQDKQNFSDGKELLRTYIGNLTREVTVSDEEAKLFFDGNQDLMGGATYDQVKNQLKAILLEDKRMWALDSHLKNMGDSISIELNKTWTHQQSVLASENVVDRARKSGRPSMVDFGADGCQPCEVMKPVLSSLKEEYRNKVNVVFVQVRDEQVLAARYGIMSIPVQIFYDKNGDEVFRHIGYYSKDEILAGFAEMGVK